MIEHSVRSRLDLLEARLLRVENLLGVAAESPVDEVVETSPSAIDPEAISLADTPGEIVASNPVQPQQKVLPHGGLEQTIGLKWAGWIGAVVLVIGAAFGIKFFYEQGWFALISPLMRMGLLAAGGVGLIALGEWVYRKVNVRSAAGLFGAGVAILFVVSFAGYAYYGLYARNTAFVFMALSTVIGEIVARRGNMVSIAVLSLIGGNLAPLLLSQGRVELTGFLTYLLFLQFTSMALAAWGASRKWWMLRGLALATTTLWVAAVMNIPPRQITQIFAMIYAALFQAELLFSASRSTGGKNSAGVTFSILVTTALTLYLYNNEAGLISIISFTLLTAMAAVIFANKTGKLRQLGLGYAIQSMALVAVAVPLAFAGIWIAAAWGILAIAYAVAGQKFKIKPAKYASLAAWLLSLLDLWQWSTIHRGVMTVIFSGLPIPQYALMGAALVLAGQWVSKLIRCDDTFEQLATLLDIVGSAIWMGISLAAFPYAAATDSILIYADLLLVADFLLDDVNLLATSAGLMILATAKWMALDMLLHRLNVDPVMQSVLLNGKEIIGFCILVSLAMLSYRVRSPQAISKLGPHIRAIVAGLFVGMLLWLGSFGIDQLFCNDRLSIAPNLADPMRAEQVALSIFWAVLALGCVVVGFGWRVRGLRYFGLFLFAVTLLKLAAVDMDQVTTGYRILSFMGLGILLLGTSVLYGKLSPVLLSPAKESRSDNG